MLDRFGGNRIRHPFAIPCQYSCPFRSLFSFFAQLPSIASQKNADEIHVCLRAPFGLVNSSCSPFHSRLRTSFLRPLRAYRCCPKRRPGRPRQAPALHSTLSPSPPFLSFALFSSQTGSLFHLLIVFSISHNYLCYPLLCTSAATCRSRRPEGQILVPSCASLVSS